MKRLLLYFIGLDTIAAAVVLSIRYDLGVATFSSVMYAAPEVYCISLGAISIICYLLLVLLQYILSKKIILTYLLEAPLSFAFGLLTDFYDMFIMDIECHVLLRMALFIATMFATAMGVCLCVRIDLVLTPTDGIVRTISEAFAAAFSTMKNAFDVSLVSVSMLLCFVNHTEFYGIEIGTILSTSFLGRIIRMYERFLYSANKKLIGK